ncbi:LytTR family transcriptional regulator [bacterium 210820-DFI.6.37]|nr:LytTR family transcriptional regulator [bacterium 210820-DFI.6.37]
MKWIIFTLEKERRKIHLRMKNGTCSFYETFKEITQRLDSCFFRCHNSYIVNLRLAERLSKEQLFFSDDIAVPVSRNHYGELRKKLLEYWKSEELRKKISEKGTEV